MSKYSDLNQAVHKLAGNQTRRPGEAKRASVQLDISEMPALIPAGSLVELEKGDPAGLRYGDVIYVNGRERAVLCRFLRFREGSSGQQEMVAAQSGARKSYPLSAWCGRVAQVTHGSKIKNPNQESSISRFLSSLTDYGTTSPLKKLLGGD